MIVARETPRRSDETSSKSKDVRASCSRSSALFLAALLTCAGACERSEPKEEPAAPITGLLPVEIRGIDGCAVDKQLKLRDCPALAHWQQSGMAKGPGGDAELLQLASYREPIIRALAVKALASRPCPSEETCAYATDRDLAETLLTRAEDERDARVSSEYAIPIAEIDVAETGLGLAEIRQAGEAVYFDKEWGFVVDTGHEHVRYEFRVCWHGTNTHERTRQCRTQWIDALPKG